MRSDLQSKISPIAPQTATPANAVNMDATGQILEKQPPKVDFLKLMQESNAEKKRENVAKEAGDLSGAKNYDDFLEKLSDQTKPRREPKNMLNKDDFLQLFVTQLKHQDPLNPDDGAAMASKLAQFNGLEQMMNVNKTLGKMLEGQNNNRNLDLISYVGKQVTIDGGKFKFEKGEVASGGYELEAPSAKTILQIKDGSGTTISEKELGAVGKGQHKLSWNGLDKEGKKVNDGLYSFFIIAKDIEDNEVNVKVSSLATVTGVDIKDQDGAIYTDLGAVKLEDIKSIGTMGFEKKVDVDKKKDEVKEKAKVAAKVDPTAEAKAAPETKPAVDVKDSKSPLKIMDKAKKDAKPAPVEKAPDVKPVKAKEMVNKTSKPEAKVSAS